MTERDVMFTGIGGQGVQIISKALATAAVNEGRSVLVVPRYGGIMRGGKTNAEVTIGSGSGLRSVPVVDDAWCGLAMDQSYWESTRPHLRSGAHILLNSSLFHVEVGVPDADAYPIPATEMAKAMGSPMSASFIMLGALVSLTGIVRLESIHAAMRQLVPAYRAQHIAANERAIDAGAAAVPALGAPAWPTTEPTTEEVPA
jgi:2-oxoglutarate ferredoxin oxidoreductase subunit gamma